MILTVSFYFVEMITINNETTTCGEEKTVVAGNEFIVKSMGESPGVDCSYVFKGQMRDNCMGLCYDMKTGSVFRDAKASLTVVAGTYSKVRRPLPCLDPEWGTGGPDSPSLT